MEDKDIVLVDEDTQRELEYLRKMLAIKDEVKFYKAVDYVRLVIDGEKRTLAYAKAFGIPISKANTVASNFHKSKWVQEIFVALRPDQESLYFGEIKQIIKVGMDIIDDKDGKPRDKIEAMKALQPYIKAEQAKSEADNAMNTAEKTVAELLDEKIEALAKSGMMVSTSGDIIDLDEIE